MDSTSREDLSNGIEIALDWDDMWDLPLKPEMPKDPEYSMTRHYLLWTAIIR